MMRADVVASNGEQPVSNAVEGIVPRRLDTLQARVMAERGSVEATASAINHFVYSQVFANPIDCTRELLAPRLRTASHFGGDGCPVQPSNLSDYRN